MGSATAKYNASTTQDVEAPSGFTFRIRGLTVPEFAELTGSVPNVDEAKPDVAAAPADPEAVKAKPDEDRAWNTKMFTMAVEGIVDEGKVERIEYDDLTVGDATFLLEAVMVRSGMRGPKLDELRRALR